MPTKNLNNRVPNPDRYKSMLYNHCGKSGLLLPKISLGLWQNFGELDSFTNAENLIYTAFDLGVTHFDLANNYGPPYGSAESTLGRILQRGLSHYRDELILSSKAGYDMWPGPYGNWGSRKYLIASANQSLHRTGLEYFDIFYHHRPDPETPLEETVSALDHLVRSGKALYVGISNYPTKQAAIAFQLLAELGTPCLIHQPRYSMFDRTIENSLLTLLKEKNVGSIAFSPLAQGLLTDKYFDSIPENSRAAKENQIYLNKKDVSEDKLDKARRLNVIAQQRGQTLAQMALAWVLRQPAITSVLIGASKPTQIEDAVNALSKLDFTSEELNTIDRILES